PLDLPAFPTRRSSDLAAVVVDEQRVARRHPDARLLLPCLEIVDVDAVAGVARGAALQPAHVDEHAARDDAFLDVVETEFRAAGVDRKSTRLNSSHQIS